MYTYLVDLFTVYSIIFFILNVMPSKVVQHDFTLYLNPRFGLPMHCNECLICGGAFYDLFVHSTVTTELTCTKLSLSA